ncbi:MAG TPA: NAD(P)-dependent oxidoreductase [Steroidobacteraceae bacterium]|nr:NAD(P)-dependent oxidoreductase [Steroidobacteraceae bacterium]
MKAVFLDFATVSTGDLDTSGLRRVLPQISLHETTTETAIPERIAGADIVLTNKLRITRELMEREPALRLVALAATGTDNVDLDAARARGIAVCNVRGYCTTSVAQHVIAVILLLTHRLREYGRLAVDGTWGSSPQFTLLGLPIRELVGRVLGIIGYGTLGRAVAERAESALGMRVLVANRAGAGHTAGRLALAELLPQVDVLSLHCPLTAATHNLIGARELALMKPDALLINTARGGLVDALALADALRAGRIGGAAIDVLPEEPPLSGSPLFAPDLPNLIVTPHIAWAAREARQRCVDEMAANIEDFLHGGTRNRVV